MFQSLIDFIVSLFDLFVKFFSDIKIDIYGHSFSFYSFFLASIIILAVCGIAINSIRQAGSRIGGDIHKAKVQSDNQKRRQANAQAKNQSKNGS